jgi:hypothetical protein
MRKVPSVEHVKSGRQRHPERVCVKTGSIKSAGMTNQDCDIEQRKKHGLVQLCTTWKPNLIKTAANTNEDELLSLEYSLMVMGNKMNIMDSILNMDEMLAKKIARVGKTGKTVISRLKGKPTAFRVKETQCMEIARDRQ